jgi:hypothetical protein
MEYLLLEFSLAGYPNIKENILRNYSDMGIKFNQQLQSPEF